MNPVGRIVREEREKKGLSQNQLAKKAGIAQASLNALESKTNNPSVETLYLLANALNCTVSKLLGESGEDAAVLLPNQRALLDIYDQLNETGKSLLIAQAESILQQPALRKKDSTRSAM